MSCLTMAMASPKSPKRSFSQAGLDAEGAFDLTAYPGQETTNDHPNTRVEASGIISQTGPIVATPIGPTSNDNVHSAPVASSSSPAKPTKKVKLSEAEKETKRIEKEIKDRQRAEDKARKEAEKAQKEAIKEAEREEKRKAKEEKDKVKEEERQRKEEAKQRKEEERQKKEEEKQRKEEEINKKKRSQLRLNAFFAQPAASGRSASGSPIREGASPLSSRRSSITEINAWETENRSRSVSATPSKPKKSDYARLFPEFYIQSHTALAPVSRFRRESKTSVDIRDSIDRAVSSKNVTGVDQDPIQKMTRQRKTRRNVVPLKQVVERLNGSISNPIDLTAQVAPTDASKESPSELLKTIPIKSLKFAEDVRPPYIGTYSKRPTVGSLFSLARKPFSRVRPDTNYDYDSEAEWEDPGEGEDLDSEGEEEIDEDEDDADMAGFLDDEELNDGSRPIKRRPLLGDLEPTCSGICWAGESFTSCGKAQPSFKEYRMDILLENPSFPIDPYSTSYWQPSVSSQPQSKFGSTAATKSPTKSQPAGRHQTTLMEPPRIPLFPVNRTNNTLPLTSSSAHSTDGANDPKPIPSNMKPTPSDTAMTAPKRSKRFIPPDLLDEFKRAIDGSDLSKVGLIEVLKKQFPKQPKDAIKDTLEVVAERVGSKASEKKWALK